MFNLYALLKYLHILFAIIAVGLNVSYGIWIARAAKEPEHLEHILRGIKFLDNRFATPGYFLLLITGLAMVFVNDIPMTTFWIAGALVLWFIAMILGFVVLTPLMRNQIRALEDKGVESAEYRRLERAGMQWGILLAIMVMMILMLMVFKPEL